MATRHSLSQVSLPDIWKFIRDPKSPLGPKLLIIISIIYLIWPLDLLPDIAPILGWLDDIGFVGFAIWYLRGKVEEWKAKQRSD